MLERSGEFPVRYFWVNKFSFYVIRSLDNILLKFYLGFIFRIGGTYGFVEITPYKQVAEQQSVETNWMPDKFFDSDHSYGDSGLDFGMSPQFVSLGSSLRRYNALLREKRNGVAREYYKVHIFVTTEIGSKPHIMPQAVVEIMEDISVNENGKELASFTGEVFAIDLNKIPNHFKGITLGPIHHRMNKLGIIMRYNAQYLTEQESVL